MDIQKILIKAKRQVLSEIIGNNQSLFEGEGYDFVELREYQLGDDVKKIDWNITAKLQQPFIKIFREERELNVVCSVMLSGSMYFGTKGIKQDSAAMATAILGFSSFFKGDPFSTHIFSGEDIISSNPSRHYNAIEKSVSNVANIDVLGNGANYHQMHKHLFHTIKRRSMIFIVGDFFGDIDLSLLARKHEVIAIIIRDRFEENPTALGFSSFVDPNSGDEFEGSLDESMVKEYKQNVEINDHKLYEHFRKHQIRFCKIYTDQEVVYELHKLFMQR